MRNTVSVTQSQSGFFFISPFFFFPTFFCWEWDCTHPQAVAVIIMIILKYLLTQTLYTTTSARLAVQNNNKKSFRLGQYNYKFKQQQQQNLNNSNHEQIHGQCTGRYYLHHTYTHMHMYTHTHMHTHINTPQQVKWSTLQKKDGGSRDLASKDRIWTDESSRQF